MERILEEYILIDEVLDLDKYEVKKGMVEVEGIKILERMREEKKKNILFKENKGNLEIMKI